jgi:amino acid adenylation domain-containing protein
VVCPVRSPVTERESGPILVAPNNTLNDFPTDKEYPRGSSLHELIEDQVERTPEAPALIFESHRFSYREVNARANRLAHYLRQVGVGPDVLVGVCAERSVEMVVALLGVMKAGGAYLPIDPAYPKERLRTMLQDADPPVLVTQERLMINLPENDIRTICLDRDDHILAREPATNPPVVTGGRNLAYAIYTSGSTGLPKCALNVHEAIVNRLLWAQHTYCLDETDRVLQKTPYSFDVSVWEFFWPLIAGACLVVARPEAHKDPTYLVDLIVKERVTTIHFVPSLFQVFLEAPDVERCVSLRRVFCSGEALPFALQGRFFRRLNAPLYNLYGPTEAAVEVTAWTCQPDGPLSIVPIGKPIWNTQIYILDANLQPVPPGAAGELHIGGVALARGYLNRPQLTAEKFISDPFSTEPGARLYKTGDLARFLPDGNIEHLGRIDRQVKIRGMRIELEEIETVLSSHPGILQAAVVAREDSPSVKRLVAYVIMRGETVAIGELRRLLESRLPEYMVPAAFVVLSELPLTASGKVDRAAFPPPAFGDDRPTRDFAPRRSPLESSLCRIWEDILNVRRVDLDDNFNDLGGDSLSAARLFIRIQEVFHKRLPLSTLLHAPTVRDLAEVLRDRSQASASPSLVAIQPEGSRPPLYVVSGIWGNVVGFRSLAPHLGLDQPLYALEPPGIDGSLPYLTRVEDLASYYIREIMTHNPSGPYHLAGYSFGGLVVFEMAQQLLARRARVGLTALLDATEWRHGQRVEQVISEAVKGHRYLARLKQIVYGPRRWEYLTSAIRRRKAHLLCKVCSLLGRPVPSSAVSMEEVNRFAAGRYVPRIYPGRLTLLRTVLSPRLAVDDPQLGWGDLAAGGIEIHEIPGGHLEITDEPHVRILAQKLASCLDQAQVDLHRPDTRTVYPAENPRPETHVAHM